MKQVPVVIIVIISTISRFNVIIIDYIVNVILISEYFHGYIKFYTIILWFESHPKLE